MSRDPWRARLLTGALLASAASFTACASSPTTPTAAPSSPTKESAMISPKQQVVELLASIESGDPAPVAYLNPQQYRQHNLMAADGVAGFVELMKQLPPGSAKVRPVRVFQDGAFVFTHSEYDFFGPKIGFDVFRFEDGKIVEHWDNLQAKASAPSPSGHTMIDGPTEVTDLDQTEANKRLVGTFIDDVLVHGRMDKMAAAFDGDAYLQHNPQIPDTVSGLGTAFAAMAEAGVAITFDRVHRVLGEGNFVLVISEGTFAGKPSSFYDLFRVEDGKIAEHWDTIEEIPPRAQWKNANGKF